VKYHVDAPFYKVAVRLLMNRDTWNKLPPHVQKLISDLMPRVEKEAAARHAEHVRKEREELAKQGVKFIAWSPEDTKRFNEIAKKVGIEEARSSLPGPRPELIKMITK